MVRTSRITQCGMPQSILSGNKRERGALRRCCTSCYLLGMGISFGINIGDVRKDKEGVGVALKSVPWYITLSESISNIYNKFAYGKGYEILRDIAEDENVRLYALKYFCDTRFAQFEGVVYLNFLRNFKVLHTAVSARATNSALSEANRLEARDWLSECLENYDFMGKVLLITSLLEQCIFLSLEMQTVNALPWELLEKQKEFGKLMRK